MLRRSFHSMKQISSDIILYKRHKRNLKKLIYSHLDGDAGKVTDLSMVYYSLHEINMMCFNSLYVPKNVHDMLMISSRLIADMKHNHDLRESLKNLYYKLSDLE